MKCLPFVDARRYVHQRKIKNQDEWNVFCKSGNKPDNIPANPRRSYKKEWISWGDWLGSNRIANQNKEYYSFVEARKMVHSLGLKSRNEWRRYVKSGKKPEKIPSNPARTFKQDWKGWGDWPGTGTIAVFNKKFKTFREARNYAQSLHLNGQNDWSEFCKSKLRPIDIPSMP